MVFAFWIIEEEIDELRRKRTLTARLKFVVVLGFQRSVLDYCEPEIRLSNNREQRTEN
jgi:hypothetical protein